ncbi:mannitol-1-phosphate 5-dehydrogenase [Halolactibacillus miurensis]|uniref:Mannitol-1-phosphate 5-dehydrogenase n=3 Tax=Halolactibacillus TaxID=306539 RepID=A0A1I6TYG6_9BACI|nr:mannitol-1-phosphate 5-dehydrogenase [Halolactibacillus miurensis]GEM04849.1 mannitol-1-phosphate 5-dehydrogenase [Halolactibacillus miurensis]SFS94241.1 mannitol-1-phosphate 5-dehydrogenase [Halolactibacillus miurensis]
MKAVHFGAGNIGRGFIGLLLSQAGYHVSFVDVNEQVIDAINDKQQYNVLLADESQEKIPVSNISGINSMKEPEAVIEVIVEADIITTAVGASILPIIADLLAKGLTKRLETANAPLNVIACENMIGGSALLKDEVMKKVTTEAANVLLTHVGFPNAAVDRIVPNQSHEDILTVSVEPYSEWVVDQSMMVGDLPDINGMTRVPSLDPFIERKLFTVNTGHAVTAYFGYHFGYHTIKETLEDEAVLALVKGALKESGQVITSKFDFSEAEHEKYIDKILGRFLNPYLSDEVTRVARGPLRKLGQHDRLVRPARLYYELVHEEPTHLAKAIAAALLYDYKEDEEAVKLQAMIEADGYEKTLEVVSHLHDSDSLTKSVLSQVDALKK